MWFRRRPSEKPVPASRETSLAMRPARNAQVVEEALDNGLVRLIYPTTVKPWFAGLALRMGLWDGAPLTRKLELDELGTFCWRMLDGNASVRDVAAALSGRYGLPRREAELAVAAFLRELGRRGVIGLAAVDQAEDSGKDG